MGEFNETKKSVLLLLIPLLVNCTVGSSSTKDRFNVVVSAYAGEVVVHRGEERYPIKLSMHLELGDMIEVPEDGYVQLLFRDGAVVRGSGGSTLGIPDEGIVRLVQGESFIMLNVNKRVALLYRHIMPKSRWLAHNLWCMPKPMRHKSRF